MLTYKTDLGLPYRTRELSGVGGQLRVSPDDFVVEEVPLYEAQGEGQHLYVNLTKVGMTTRDVQAKLERLFGLRRGEVSFAGMKDKRARTTQSFSLNVGYQPPEFAAAAVRHIEEALPVTVNWTRFHRNKLRPGHLLGNRFTIVISDLAVEPATAIVWAEAVASQIRRRGLPNYFGPQRLGVDGSNVRQGLAVLRGETQKQDRWLRRFLLSAFQSYLCNRYLARRLEMGAFDHLLEGDVAKKYATGGMFDVFELEREQPRYAAQEISFTAPIYGPKMWAAAGASAALEAEILREAQVTLEDFGRLHVEGTRRLGRLLVPELQVELRDSSLIVTFFLPKGAFATTVLREIMKADPATLATLEEDTDDQ